MVDETSPAVEEATELPEPKPLPGFAVMAGKTLLGVFDTKLDAECYAEGHPGAGGIKTTIVEQ